MDLDLDVSIYYFHFSSNNQLVDVKKIKNKKKMQDDSKGLNPKII